NISSTLSSKDDIMSICSQFEVSEDNNHSVIHTGFQNIEWPGSIHDARVYSNSDFYLNRTEYIQDEDYVL
ncbi:6599_t:CDS:2, partial [Funneliformis geosporum]